VQTPTVELTAHVNGVVDVSVGLAIATYQVGYRVHAGAVDSLAWNLPRGSTLVSVESPELSGYVIESGESDVRRLILDFATPQTGSIVVTATLAQPLPRGAVEFEIPPLGIDAVSEQAGHTTLGRYQVAFRQPVDFRLVVAAASPNVVAKPRAIEDFLSDWPLGGVLPQEAYELIRAGAFRLSLRDLPIGLAAGSECHGRFTRGMLHWSFLAEIEPPVVPPFQYRLHVDSRLRIRNVSVQEEGADRLLRWSHLDDTLVLFLNDRALRTQTLLVDATLPITNADEVALPRIELMGVPAGPTMLTLTHSPDVKVVIASEHPASVEGRTSSDPNRNQAGASSSIVPIEIPAGGAFPRVQVEEVMPVTKSQIATIVRRVGAEDAMTVAVEYEVLSGRVLQFELETPAELAQRASIETSLEAETIRRPGTDGRTHLTFLTRQPVAGRFRVTLQVPVAIPFTGDRGAAGVTLPGIPVESRLLILSREYAVDLIPGSIPEWVSVSFGEELDFSRLASYMLTANEPLPSIRLQNERSDESSESLAHVTVEYDSRGSLSGRYVICLPDRPPDSLVFDWPEGAEPVAVLLDDQPQPVSPPANGTWTLPLQRATAPRLVCIAWIDHGDSRIGLVGKVHARLPALRNPAVATELLTTSVSPEWVAHRPSSESGKTEIIAALARLRMELSAIERSSAQPNRDESMWLNNALASDGDRVSTVTRLSPNPARPQMAGPTSSEGIWVSRRFAYDTLLGSVAALVVALVTWKSARFWLWLQEREALAWIVLGLLWRFALEPRAFGFVLIAWGVLVFVRFVTGRRHAPSEFEMGPTNG
jgi:hypothetical protein